MTESELRIKILTELSNELVRMHPEYILDYIEEQISIEKYGI